MWSEQAQALLGRGWDDLIVRWEIGAHLPALPVADGEAGTACVARGCRSPRIQGQGRGARRPGLGRAARLLGGEARVPLWELGGGDCGEARGPRS